MTLIEWYIQATATLRDDDYLLISYVKPFRAAHVDTIRRWIINVLKLAGIDTNKFTAHSTRSASNSKAKAKHVPLSTILAAGMWASSSTFGRFYNKPIMGQDPQITFQEAILNIKGSENM